MHASVVEVDWKGREGRKEGRAVRFFDSAALTHSHGGERGQRTNNDRSYELARQPSSPLGTPATYDLCR